ncbi:MAG: hydroxymethylbilane synthase [Pseudomonadota bacterium]
MPILRIATRKSPLARWQAEQVAQQLTRLNSTLTPVIRGFSTQGDKIQDTPLAKVGGKGLFVKELEVSLLQHTADIAVHSIKDMPVLLPEGLHLAAILPRADPRDAFVSHQYATLNDLPAGACLGTSSLRRACQIRHQYPHLRIESLRGNLNTRLAKLDAGEYAAILLAAAGLQRLELTQRIRQYIPAHISLPAIGQGAIGVECRVDDQVTRQLLTALHDADTAACVTAERAMNRRLEGGCQVPIGGHAIWRDGQIWLRGLVGAVDGSRILHAEGYAPGDQAESLGTQVADALLAQGAAELLRSAG